MTAPIAPFACLFCGRELLNMSFALDLSGYFYSCPFCGKYTIENAAEELFKGDFAKKRHLAAGYLHSTFGKTGIPPIITQENCATFFDNPEVPKNAMEKLEKLLIFFYLENDSVSATYELKAYAKEAEQFYAQDEVELSLMLDELDEMGFIELKPKSPRVDDINVRKFRLTTRGLVRAAELAASTSYSKKVFVAMAFREDLLCAKDEAIKSACAHCGFIADTVTQDHNGDITDKIIAEIKASRFVVCDFTYGNQGAYYEAGFARGLGLPVICCCNRDWFEETDGSGARVNRLHFDVEHINTIFWSTHEELREKLINRIKATIV